ncbi:MAG: UDP-N-acetylmuramate dehydrogenase [Planctomycetota bacterium]
MNASAPVMSVVRDAPLSTWFRIGGRAERLARPSTVAEVARCVRADPRCRVVGEGANLLVDDDGIDGLCLQLTSGELGRFEIDKREARVLAGAGASLPRLISACVRAGLAGPERLAGIPSSIGGAAAMNAGGAFGAFADLVRAVHVVTRDGHARVLDRADIAFDYRHGVPGDAIVTLVDLQLEPEDPEVIRARRDEIMAYKSRTQPMSERSAGCAFRNPTLSADLDSPDGPIGARGERVSAGMLIDRAGCKGLTFGGAGVSEQHANFITTSEGATARDVIGLMDLVRERVFDRFGVRLQREVVVWSRHAEHLDEDASIGDVA